MALCERKSVFKISDNFWYSSDNDWDEFYVSPGSFTVGNVPTLTTTMSTPAPTVKAASTTTLHDTFAKLVKNLF